MDNNEFEIIDRFAYGRSLVRYTGTDRVVRVPEEVQHINNNAFENVDFVDTVIIPESVSSIGSEAFKGSSVSHLTLPQSISMLGYSVFENCKSLKTLEIQNPNIKFFGAPFKNPPADFEIIFSGTSAQFQKTAERAFVCSGEHQSGDYYHPSSTQFEYYRYTIYEHIFSDTLDTPFTCRVKCTDGELVYHEMAKSSFVVKS